MECLQTNPSLWLRAVKAQQLVDAGLEKIADLREPKFLAMLNNAQKLSLQYMQHLEKPVSREEAETVAVSQPLPLINITV